MHSVGQFLPDSPIDHLVLLDEALAPKGAGDDLDAEVITRTGEVPHADLGAGNTGFNERLELLGIHGRAGCCRGSTIKKSGARMAAALTV